MCSWQGAEGTWHTLDDRCISLQQLRRGHVEKCQGWETPRLLVLTFYVSILVSSWRRSQRVGYMSHELVREIL